MLLYLHAVFVGCHACLALEVLAEEGWIGEVEVFGDLVDGLVGVHQVHLDADDERLVNPPLGSDAAGLTDDGTEVTFGKA